MTLALKAILSLDAKGFAQATAASGERLRNLKGQADQAAAGMETLSTASDRATRSLAVAIAVDVKRATAQQQLVQAQREATAAQAALSQVNDDAADMAQQLADADQRRRQALDQVATAQANVTAAQARLTAANDEAEQVNRTLFEAEQARRQALEGLTRTQTQSAAAAQREVEVLDLLRDAARGATAADLARGQALEARIRQARDGAVAELQVARAVTAATGDYRAMADAARNLQAVQGQLTAVQAAQAAIVRQIRDQYVPLEAQLTQHHRTLEEIGDAERAGILTEVEAVAARERATAALKKAEAAARGSAGGTKLAAHEVTNLTFQLQDAAVQLAGGQNPFLILLQQGPQATGAVGGLDRALKLIPPGLLAVGAAAAAVIAVAVTAYKAWNDYRESVLAVDRANRLAVISTGLTRDGLDAQARAGADAAQISLQSARDLQAGYIATGRIGTDVITGLIGVTRDFAVATSQDSATAGADLARAFADPVRGAQELTQRIGLLDDRALANVRSLYAMGRTADAQAIILDALRLRVKGAADEMSLLDRAGLALGRKLSDYWDSLGKGLARLADGPSPSQKLAEETAELARQKSNLEFIINGRAAQGQTADNNSYIAAKAAELQKVNDLIAAAEAEKNRIAKQGADERARQEAVEFGRVAADVARQLDDFAARKQQLNEQANQLDNGLNKGSGLNDQAQVALELDRVRNALDTLIPEQEKARQLSEAEAAAVNLTGVAREKYLAKVRAEIETRGELLTKSERQAKIDQAVAAVTHEHAAALTDLTAQQKLALAAQARLADAAGQGAAAQRAANDANEIAAASARSAAEGALARAAAQQREAETVRQLTNETVGGLRLQTDANLRMAAAAGRGAEAVRAAQRAEFERAKAAELGAARIGELTQVLAAYDDELASEDRLKGAQAIAAQVQELGEVNALLEVEQANLTASNRQRSLAIAHQQALNELAKIGVGWTDAEKDAWLANADAIAAARQQADGLATLRDQAADIASDVSDAIYDGLTGRGDSIRNWFKNLFKRIAVEAIKAQIVLPITTQIVGSAPGLFAQAGQAGGGGLGGLANFIGGGGLARGINGLTGLLSGSGGFNLSSLSNLFGGGVSSGAASLQTALFGRVGIRGTGATGLFGSSGTLFGSATAATGVAGALSGIGTGALAGQVLGALGIGRGNATGSAIGGAIGGAIGSIVPGIGTILGSIAGGALGSLFGHRPSNREGSAVIDLNAGSYQVGGFTGRRFSQANRDAAAQIADQVLALRQTLEGFGARITGTLAVGAGDRDGLFATGLNSTARTRFDRSETGTQQLLAFVAQQFVAEIGSQLPAEISAALGRVDFSDLQQAGGDLDFIKGFRDSLTALRGDIGLVDDVTAQASAEVRTQIDALQNFHDTAARLFPDALGEADAALRSYVDGLVGVREASAPPTEVENALAALQARWQAYIPLLQQVGYTTTQAQDIITAGLNRARGAARSDFVAGLDRDYNSLAGNDYINRIRDVQASRDSSYRDADALGVSRAVVDRNVGAALAGILTTDLRADQLQEAVRLFGTSFPEAAQAAQTALASLTNTLGDAAAQAERAARTGQALDGLADRMDRATGRADTLAGALAAFDRAAAQERAATQARIDAGEIGAEVLTQTEITLTAERIAIAQRAAARVADVTRSIADREFALSVAGRPDADIRQLERRQNAEFQAAQAAGYTQEQLTRLAAVLAGEMTAAVNQLNAATQAAAEQAQAAARAVNDNLADRYFAATNDNSTLEGALAAFDRQAARERVQTAMTAGADLAALERTLGAERQAVVERFTQQAIDAENQRQAALTQAGGQLRTWIDGIRAATGTPQQQLSTVRAQFQQQLALARTGDVDALGGIRDYAQRLIDAETARTASGADRRAAVEGVLAQVESLAAVQSFDAQQLSVLTQIRDETIVNRSAFTAAVAALPASATSSQIAAALLPHFQLIDQSLDGLITPAEFRAAIGPLATDATAARWFAQLDANGDGLLDQQELTTRTTAGLSGGATGTLKAISDLTYAGNRDRITIGDTIVRQLGTLGTIIADGNQRIANLHAWQASVWTVESQLLDKTKYNTAETAKALHGGYAYAGGTDFHPGGLALVGEEGPERVFLPRGAQVFTREQTLALARQPRTAIIGVAGGGGDSRALTTAIERQARATERQNVLLEKIATSSANTAGAAAETAKAMKTPPRVRVGSVAKLAGAGR